MDVLYPATVGPETNATATLGVKRDSANRTFTQEVHSVEKDVRKVSGFYITLLLSYCMITGYTYQVEMSWLQYGTRLSMS